MIDTTYRAGHWLGIVRSGSVIVLEAQTDPAIVDALWEYLGSGDPTIHGVLNAVTSQFGTDLTGMPHFGILVETDRLHVILRGGMSLTVQIAGSADTVSGRDVTTWSERSMTLPDSLVLTLDAETPAEGGSAALPLKEAVVLLSELSQGVPGWSGAVAGGAVPSGAVAGGAGVPPESFDAVASPSVGTGGLSVAGNVASEESGTDFASGPDFAASTGPESSIGPESSEDPESGAIAGDGPVAASAAETEQAGNGNDGRDQDGTGHGSQGMDSSGLESTALDGADHAEAGTGDTDFGATAFDSTDSGGAGLDSAAHTDADLGDTIDGGAAADDEDDYAGFALAADAEWTAELAETSDTNLDFGHGDGVDSGGGEQEWPSPAVDEGDLGQAIYPHLGHDDAQQGFAATEASKSGDAAGSPAGGDFADFADGAPGAEDGGSNGSGDLFGATELRSAEDAATRFDENGHEIPNESAGPVVVNIPPQPPMPPAAGQRRDVQDEDVRKEEVQVEEGNHATDKAESEETDDDSQTETRSALADGDSRAVPAGAPLESRPTTGPMVVARLCPAGHANPPSRSQCSDCGAAIDSEPREVGRPRLGRMRISTGEVLDLDHSLVIGRQPSVSRVMGGVMPRLVQVHSASGDISRSHVEVRLDGWDVLLVDLEATNGTVLVREGQAPRRLSQGEQAILLNGDIAELGDGVWLRFEELL